MDVPRVHTVHREALYVQIVRLVLLRPLQIARPPPRVPRARRAGHLDPVARHAIRDTIVAQAKQIVHRAQLESGKMYRGRLNVTTVLWADTRGPLEIPSARAVPWVSDPYTINRPVRIA